MNPYQVLKITKYSTQEEVRLAYKKLVKRHHPDTGDGDTQKLEEAREAYIRLKDKHPTKNLTVSIIVPISNEELAKTLGKTSTFEYDDIMFDVFIPYETRMNDTITVKDILPNTELKIKFKDKNESTTR